MCPFKEVALEKFIPFVAELFHCFIFEVITNSTPGLSNISYKPCNLWAIEVMVFNRVIIFIIILFL